MTRQRDLEIFGIKKLPSPEILNVEIDRLQKKHSGHSTELKKLVRQKKELFVVRNNFEEMLKTENISVEKCNFATEINRSTLLLS